MDIIAITGGKGGTGKSTVSLLLAKKLSKEKNVLLIDADVECPNDHLFLGLGKKVGNAYQKFPHINENCDGCGLCVEKCPQKALFKIDKKPILIENMCDGCSVCYHVCPKKAIEMKKKIVGTFYLNKGRINLLTGIAKNGIEETGGVVEQLLEFSKKIKADIKIIDTAAGTHCSVIRALNYADIIYLVTEPTPLGYEDMKIIYELIKKMDKKLKLIVNKYEKNAISKKIEEFCNKENIEIIEKIPYSEKIAKGYAEGRI